MKRAYIYDYGSKYCPVLMRFTVNNVEYSMVYETVEQAQHYYACLYGIPKRDYNKVFVDRRKGRW